MAFIRRMLHQIYRKLINLWKSLGTLSFLIPTSEVYVFDLGGDFATRKWFPYLSGAEILVFCCFGIMISYTVGLLFSFNLYFAPFALALLSFAVHFSLYKLNLTRPPGNFFFIMLASMAICTPFHLESIPEKVGYVAIGTILTCALGLIYSLLTLKETHETEIKFPQKKYTPTL